MKAQAPRHSEKAQSLVEFAISAAIILMLLVGVVDFGRAFYTYVSLRDAAQEGAIYGSMFPKDPAGIVARVRGSSSMPVDLTSTDILVTCYYIETSGNEGCSSGGTPIPGTYIQITVSYPTFQLSMPFLGAILGSQTIPLQATVKDTILRIEEP